MSQGKYHTEEDDWHRADIICSIKKTGTSITALSRESGLAPSTLANALYRHWPRGESIIATALGVSPSEIWPSRYKVIKR